MRTEQMSEGTRREAEEVRGPNPLISRFPERREVYAALHALLRRHVPEPEPFDEAMRMFEGASPIERNHLRRETVHRALGYLLDELRESLAEPAPDANNAADAVQAKDIDAEFLLGRATSDVWRSAVQGIAHARAWSVEKAAAYVARGSAVLLRRALPEGTVRLTQTQVLACADTCAVHLSRHIAGAHAFVIDGVARRSMLLDRSLLAPSLPEEPMQTGDDTSAIARVESLSSVERARTLIGIVRRATDAIRTTLIPELVREGVGVREAFWRIHAAHFAENPLLSHMHSTAFQAVDEYARTDGGAELYRRSVGKARQNSVGTLFGDHVKAQYVASLEQRLFAELERALPSVRTEEDFLDLLTRADMALITLHPSFDGAGRTTEDFFAYLGERLGYPLTLSVTGYRHAVGDGVDERTKANTAFKRERDSRCLRNLDLAPNPAVPGAQWRKYVDGLIAERYGARQGDLYASEQALEAGRLIDAIRTPTAVPMYESAGALRAAWVVGRSLRYARAADAEVADACDALVAEASVEFTRQTWEKFAQMERNYPDDPLVREITDEYLRPFRPKGVARLVRALGTSEHTAPKEE